MIVDALRVFATVAEQRHFSRAGELLNLSQPGVSLHIRNLENELGTKLLHRSPKEVRLTEAGAILYKHVKQILSHYEEAGRKSNCCAMKSREYSYRGQLYDWRVHPAWQNCRVRQSIPAGESAGHDSQYRGDYCRH